MKYVHISIDERKTDEVELRIGSGKEEDGAYVISLEPTTVLGVAETFVEVANVCGVKSKGEEMKTNFLSSFETLRSMVTSNSSKKQQKKKPKVLMLEWLDPPFDGGHWVSNF